MRKYIKPEFEMIKLEKTDVIQTSTLDTQGTTISTIDYQNNLTQTIDPSKFDVVNN